MADMWALTSIDGDGLVGTNIYDNESAFISAVRDQLVELSAIAPRGLMQVVSHQQNGAAGQRPSVAQGAERRQASISARGLLRGRRSRARRM